jgi:hypothetical protein
MGKVKLPPIIIEKINMYRKHCMWRGSNLNNKKPPLAAWSLISYRTRPQKVGDLGILNLKTQNDDLLKSLHKIFNKPSVFIGFLLYNCQYWIVACAFML